ncbi:MAG: prepilin-type N-terminal cleavage/methylation domain-containing protein [Candidatus Pacebacteria bacterium]|nr:prepilin-type N-terminal cleavage/methylation domain-containing protein [Candidatus Paceibacterota bacterium]
MFVEKYKKGFTLTELLIVVAIIGILSSIVLTSMGNVREKAKDAKRISDIKQIQLALELYYDVNSSYPSAIYTGTPLSDFLRISKDPDGSDYFYYSPANGQDYHLGAVLRQTNNVLENDDNSNDGFEGNGPDCVNSGVSNMCYDVTP